MRPRIQVPILVALSLLWGLLGLTFFTNGEVARRDWFGIVLGSVSILMGVAGVWRSLRLATLSYQRASSAMQHR